MIQKWNVVSGKNRLQPPIIKKQKLNVPALFQPRNLHLRFFFLQLKQKKMKKKKWHHAKKLRVFYFFTTQNENYFSGVLFAGNRKIKLNLFHVLYYTPLNFPPVVVNVYQNANTQWESLWKFLFYSFQNSLTQYNSRYFEKEITTVRFRCNTGGCR